MIENSLFSESTCSLGTHERDGVAGREGASLLSSKSIPLETPPTGRLTKETILL